MAVEPGGRLGHYEIAAILGEGGMGRVYRARDTKLQRAVAIKVLPDDVAADPERVARFEREARTLAALNHPHIAQIYGTEQSGTTHALVMELVEGDDLAERLRHGPLPLNEATPMALQIAEALEAAHEQGIVHRDLKPANIKITPDGTVKVLDFGLAKAVEPGDAAQAAGTSALANSPTITSPAGVTRAGVILGTAAYMSPEQAKGRPADKRSDVWAFGCVFYEMLTARRAFPGDDVMETLSAVIRGEPDWSALPKDVPIAARRLLQRCLVKDRRARVSDIGVVRYALEPGNLAAPAGAAPARPAWPVALVAVAGIIAITSVALPRRGGSGESAPPTVVRATIAAPYVSTQGFVSLAISPAGSHLAYASTQGRLYLHKLSDGTAQPLPGSEDATQPFFSPDGEWLAFFAEGKLKKVPVAGGAPRVLADAPSGRGGSWGPDGTIVFAPEGTTGLSKVSADGGDVTRLTTVKPSELTHRWPHILPDGRHVLFTIVAGGQLYDDARIAVVPIAGGEPRVVIDGGFHPRYLSTGHLLYARGSNVFATAFDPVAVRATGAAISVIGNSRNNTLNGSVPLAVSAAGTLVYLPGTSGGEGTLSAATRTGRLQTLLDRRRFDGVVRFSPDGRRVAIGLSEGQVDIWFLDLDTRGLERFTFGSGSKTFPVWSPDGSRVYYMSSATARPHLEMKTIDGSATATVHPATFFPTTISPDGGTLAGRAIMGRSATYDVVGVDVARTEAPRGLIATSANESGAAFSPDGRFLAYHSDEMGRLEVFVQAYPSGNKWQVTTTGGADPRWTKNGRELIYRSGASLVAVPVTLQPFSVGAQQTLFTAPNLTLFDVTADGQRFAIVQDIERQDDAGFALVTGWFEELKAKMRPAR